jgi:energy-coupling factor transporter ATP-binding protein EcfA2
MKGSRPPDPSDEGLDKGEGPAFATHGTPGRRSAEKNMLKRLKLHRFRYIKPGTELMFTERFNVLLGRNGTGKTTLLDLISIVLRSDFSALKDEAFDIEYEWSNDRGTGLVRFANKLKSPLPGLSASSSSRGSGRSRQYHPHVVVRLQPAGEGQVVEIDVEGAFVRLRAGDRQTDSDNVDVFEDGFLFQLGAAAETLDAGATVVAYQYMFHGIWAFRFDESLGVFDGITSGDAGRAPKPGQAPNVTFATRFDGGNPRVTFTPSRYQPTLPGPGQSSTKVELPRGSSLARFSQLTSLNNMFMSLAVEGSQQEADGLWWRFGHAEFLFSGARGLVFNHDALSYGQKRLLAFLYYLDANPAFVVADDLVNGMHHDWIRASLDEIGARQAFLTSQNPLLLDYIPLESVEQIEKTFVQCRTEIVDEEPQIAWSNLAAEDAAELFADYKVGIQPLGEILRVRGLW